MANLMPAALLAQRCIERYKAGDGYIMGSTGQNPKKWAETSWWFTQYSGTQKTKALYWREHAERVWDCQGLIEGLYNDYAGTTINVRARNNYASWCGEKGSGMIPASKRQPGAVVFWSDDTAANIHHVAVLTEPVDAKKPEGDWYLVEARGVMYGVVQTKLLSRKPNYWGLMTKYFTYDGVKEYKLGDRELYKGAKGNDVAEIQNYLISLGYKLPKYGADGDYGAETEAAVKLYQQDKGMAISGKWGISELDSMGKDAPITPEIKEEPAEVGTNPKVLSGSWHIRVAPSTGSESLGIVKAGDSVQVVETDWAPVMYNGTLAWLSPKAFR